MNCQGAIEKLSEHLDRVLPQAEAAEVESHLASCAACRAEMEALRRAVDAVKALPRVRAPRNFAVGVMGAIRAEARPVAEPVKVTPIRSVTVFVRLLASVAAICLVWVGVRTMRTGGTVPTERPTASQPNETARTEDHRKSLALNPEIPSLKGAADKNRNDVERREAGWAKSPVPAKDMEAGKPAGTKDPAPAEVAHNAGPKAPGAPRADEHAEPKELQVQRLTVYSTDRKSDATQVQKLLSDAGYTWSTQSGAILARVPASEATRLMSSLGAMPGGFRAGDRESLDALERLKKDKECLADAAKSKDEPGAKSVLVAEADDLKQALRDHIRESQKQIRKEEESKKQKTAEGRAGAPGRGMIAGAAEGKSPPRDAKESDSKGGTTDGGVAMDDQNEKADSAAASPATSAGTGSAGSRPPEAGGRPAGGEDEKKIEKKGDAYAAGQAGGGGVRKAPAADPASENGGTDEFGRRARREKELSDKLSEEMEKQKESQKLADGEDAVVIYIEFADPPVAEPPAKPAAK